MSKSENYQEQNDNIQNLNSDQIKHNLIQNGLWPQYTKRIKNLEKVEQEFWNLFENEQDHTKRLRTLENIANLQALISNCYVAAKEIILTNDIQK